MSDRPLPPNYSLPIVAASIILAGAMVFSAIFLSSKLTSLAQSEQVQVDDEDDDANEPEGQDRVSAAQQQFIEQIAPLAKYLQDLKVQSVRITHNDKMMRIDFTGKTAAGRPADSYHVELTEDASGRYLGAVTIGGEKVNLVIY